MAQTETRKNCEKNPSSKSKTPRKSPSKTPIKLVKSNEKATVKSIEFREGSPNKTSQDSAAHVSTPGKGRRTTAASSTTAAQNSGLSLASPARHYNTPGKQLKKVKVVNVTNKDDVKIIKRFSLRRRLHKPSVLASPAKKTSAPSEKSISSPKKQATKSKPSVSPKAEPSPEFTRLRSPRKPVGELYKNRHNIGRRSAGRVSSYKESEVAVLFPDDYQWPAAKWGRDSAYQSQTTASSSDSDDEIIFNTPKKYPQHEDSKSPPFEQLSVKESDAAVANSQQSPKRKRSPSVQAKQKNSKKVVPKTKTKDIKRLTKQLSKPKQTTKKETVSKSKLSNSSIDESSPSKRGRSPNGKADGSPVKKREISPSQKDKGSPDQQGHNSITPKRISSPAQKRDNSPAHKGDRARSRSPIEKHHGSPAQKRRSSPVQKKKRKSKFDGLRPRAPRIQRTACLNASAINSLLYSNAGSSASKSETNEYSDTPCTSSSAASLDREKKPVVKSRAKSVKVATNKQTVKAKPAKKRKSDSDVEISLWAPPKRMASLNAQAMMTAYRELEDVKPEKPPKTPKETKVKSAKTKTSTAEPPAVCNVPDKQAVSADETPSVRFVARHDPVSSSESHSALSSAQSPAHHDIINVVDDTDVSPRQQSVAVLSAVSSSRDGQVVDSPPLQHRPYADYSKSPQKSKVPTPKPKAQYPPVVMAAQYRPPIPSVPFTAAVGIQTLYPVNTPAVASVGGLGVAAAAVDQKRLGGTMPPAPFGAAAQFMFPGHSSPYKQQHPTVQTVPPYPPPASYHNAASTQYSTSQPSLTSHASTLSSAPMYTQAYKSSGMTSSGSTPNVFKSAAVPPSAASSQHTVVTQPLQLQPYSQSFPAGYPIMNYARPDFAHQSALVNSYQMLPPAQQGQLGMRPFVQRLPQNVASQPQPANFFLNYGYPATPGSMITGLPNSPYFAMQMSPTNVKPFTQQLITSTPQQLYPAATDPKHSSKQLPIAPKPADVGVRPDGSLGLPKSQPFSVDAIDLTKVDTASPAGRSKKPAVIVTSNVQLSTQLITKASAALSSGSTVVASAVPGKPTKDILDLDSKKVKVHTGAVGELERHSPLKIPKGAKSASLGQTKKQKVDANQKSSDKVPKAGKATAMPTSVTSSAGLPVPTPAVAGQKKKSAKATTTSSGSTQQMAATVPRAAVHRAPAVVSRPGLHRAPTAVSQPAAPGVVPASLLNIPGVNPSLMRVPFPARHILPGQINMPRGHYQARAMPAVRSNFAFSMQSMTNPRMSPVKQPHNVPNSIVNKPKAKHDQSVKVKSASVGGQNAESHVSVALSGTQQQKAKPSKASTQSTKAGKGDDTKAGSKENGLKVNTKQKKITDSKAKGDVTNKPKTSKPVSPRSKSDTQKCKPETVKVKSESSKKDGVKVKGDNKSKPEVKAKKDDQKMTASGGKTLTVGAKKERRRSTDERKTSSTANSDNRKRAQSSSTPAPVSWAWEGQPEMRLNQFVRSEQAPILRKFYPAIRHSDGDIIRVRDCVLVKSGSRKKDIPFVAKIAALWDNGEMMMNIFWYYRPEQTDTDRLPKTEDNEIFASRHRDVIPVACIDDKAYVLTFNKYCRYKTEQKRMREGLPPRTEIVPTSGADDEADYCPPPPDAPPETVFLCRKVYDVKLRRFLKNPQVTSVHSPMSSKPHSVSSKSPSPKAPPTPPSSFDMTLGRARANTLPSPMSPDAGVFVLHSSYLPPSLQKGPVKVLKHDTVVAPLDIALPCDATAAVLDKSTCSDEADKTVDALHHDAAVCDDSTEKTVDGLRNDAAVCDVTETTVAGLRNDAAMCDASEKNSPVSEHLSTATRAHVTGHPAVRAHVTEHPAADELTPVTSTQVRHDSKVTSVSKTNDSTHHSDSNSTTVPCTQTSTDTLASTAIISAAAVTSQSTSITAPSVAQCDKLTSARPPFETYKFVARNNEHTLTSSEAAHCNLAVKPSSQSKVIASVEVSKTENAINSEASSSVELNQVNEMVHEVTPVPEASSNCSADIDGSENSASTATAVDANIRDTQETVTADVVEKLESGGSQAELVTSDESQVVSDVKSSSLPVTPTRPRLRKDVASLSDTPTSTRSRRSDVDLNVSLDSDKTIDAENVSFFEANMSSSTDDSECRDDDIDDDEPVIRDVTIAEDDPVAKRQLLLTSGLLGQRSSIATPATSTQVIATQAMLVTDSMTRRPVTSAPATVTLPPVAEVSTTPPVAVSLPPFETLCSRQTVRSAPPASDGAGPVARSSPVVVLAESLSPIASDEKRGDSNSVESSAVSSVSGGVSRIEQIVSQIKKTSTGSGALADAP